MAISKGLSKTREQQLSSIAFPPLGIKDLHLPSNEVAEIMVEEIMHFAEEQTGKKLDVYIVISLDNIDVYEVSLLNIPCKGSKENIWYYQSVLPMRLKLLSLHYYE